MGDLLIMPKRILIAEDEQSSREMLSAFAISQGYDVISAADGGDLLLLASEEHFDLIITDLMMAGLDGVTATDILKMHDKTTPIIVVTSLDQQETSFLENKFTKIYHKPGDFKELFDYIGSLIGN